MYDSVDIINPTEAYEEVPRALATLGLLRKVTDRTPLDLLLVYVEQTHNYEGGDGIKQVLQEAVFTNEPGSTVIPGGIYKMARDYLIRSFWEQIAHIRSEVCGWRVDGRVEPRRHSSSETRFRTYPKQILDVIKGMNISSNFTLFDIRNAVHDLHDACLSVRDCGVYNKWEQQKLYPIESIHERNLSTLRAVMSNYKWNVVNSMGIPNEIEKNVLIDLLEIMVMMFSEMPFNEVYCYKTAYDYACKNTDDEHTAELFSRALPKKYKLREFRDERTESVTSMEGLFQHMSPEAITCIDIDGWQWRFDDVQAATKKLGNVIVPEVKIYVRTELEVYYTKKRYMEKVIEKFHSLHGDNCCGREVCVEDPAPCCCG